MDGMFSECQALTSLDVTNFNTANVTSISGMFQLMGRLTSLDLSNFDTRNVLYFDAIFYYCSSLVNLNISSFDTTNAKSMSSIFYYCFKLPSLDLSNFNTTNVTNMQMMFQACTRLTSLNVSSFTTTNAINMVSMFNNCTALTYLDLSGFGDITSQEYANTIISQVPALTHLKLGNLTKLASLPVLSTDTGNGWRLNNSGEGYTNVELLQSYDGPTMAGDWYWAFVPTLTLQDLTLYTSDSWHPVDNFVSATDTTKYKNAVPFDQVTVSGTVDSHTPGSYTVTYSYCNLSKEATITVLTDQSAINLKNSEISLYSDETWDPITNFVSAKNKAGDVVPFDQVTVNSLVDTNISGSYPVTYSSGSASVTVEVTVLQNASYALQLPANQRLSQTNEPKVEQTKGTDINYNIKLFNTADGQAYSGDSNIQLTVTSQNHWQLKGEDNSFGANYKLKDVNGQDITTEVDYSFNLDKTLNEKTLVAYLTSKADKSGTYSDVVTFNYQRVP